MKYGLYQKGSSYTKERDKVVRKALRMLAEENGWRVVNEFREGIVTKEIYACR